MPITLHLASELLKDVHCPSEPFMTEQKWLLLRSLKTEHFELALFWYAEHSPALPPDPEVLEPLKTEQNWLGSFIPLPYPVTEHWRFWAPVPLSREEQVAVFVEPLPSTEHWAGWSL